MPRPKCQRQVSGLPASMYFKPRGIPMADLEEVVLTIDEVEAIRLADFEGMYQEQAAEKMRISRQTFGRVIAVAHRKIAEAIVAGKALRIEGGVIGFSQAADYQCIGCGHILATASGTGSPDTCPSCGSGSVDRLPCAAPGRRRGQRGK